mgnify:CR=1 FL=1
MKSSFPLNFIWPEMLWLLVAVPLLVLAYLWLLARRKKTALRYANLALVKQAMGRSAGWRRHVPPALLLLAIAVLLVAIRRQRISLRPLWGIDDRLKNEGDGALTAPEIASLVPVMAMLAAIPLLGEVPGMTDVIGIGVITAGVFLASGAYSALGFEAKFSRSATK